VPLSAIETAPAPVNPATNPEVPALPASPPAVSEIQTAPAFVPTPTVIRDETGQVASLQRNEFGDLYAPLPADPSVSSIQTSATAVDPNAGISSADLGTTAFIAPTDTTSGSPATSDIKAGQDSLPKQPGIADQTGQVASNTDWRLRISLAKGATYLYKAQASKGDTSGKTGPGILQPLAATNGVIFPYTPKIDMGYKANYSNYDLTHSNYRGYFYQNSNISDINITGHFTAQNTAQANYLLAVIHFFRSATKMFYGAKDPNRGSPPPLVFMSGLGQYQFNNHPCVITEFAYNLPEDVDYIRASVINNVGLNASTISNVLNSGVAAGKITGNARLAAAFTTPGALPNIPFGSPNTPNNATGVPTYVPTKMDITLRLLPVQSRQQVSKTFNLPEFANGSLLRGGFW
jgi:hypothetical protein